MDKYITFDNVSKIYSSGEVETAAVQNVSFGIDQGEFCVIVGSSGAGKSTILNMLGGTDYCTEGSIAVDGRVISEYDRRKITEYRRHEVGFVFQFYNLMHNLTALENVEMAADLVPDPLPADKLLDLVGLADCMDKFPAQLSGGEQQRVAIARALAKNPKILLCDEPTGALDDETGIQVLSLLQETSKVSGMTIVLITHNMAITQMAQRIIRMRSGKISNITLNSYQKKPEEIEW